MTTLSILPKVMKAAVVDAAGPPEAIHIKEVPVPALPSRTRFLSRSQYVGVGIWDAEQRAGSWGSVKPGTIMGADGSGTIAAVGSHVTKFHVGDRVYSYSYGTAVADSTRNMSAFRVTGSLQFPHTWK